MFRIRCIHDDILPINKEAIVQVQHILKTQIQGLASADIERLPGQLANPLKYKFRSILFVADDNKGQVKGFALLQHATDLNFCYLDYISAAEQSTGRGIGGALYERIREEAFLFGAEGLFFECLPDDPEVCKDSSKLKQNAARLRFYERYGARPLAGTAYETPLSPQDDCPPYLVFDSLEPDLPLSAAKARSIVRAILERKYADVCPSSYVNKVVKSITDDPVRLRPARYIRTAIVSLKRVSSSIDNQIALVINDRHDIHHVRDRGYVEAPVRINSILKEIIPTGLFKQVKVKRYAKKHITAVHDSGYVRYLQRVCKNVPPNKSVYPYVFPIRNAKRPPKELPIRAGYYCIDTFTPLNENAYLAAKRAVDCCLTAADSLLAGHRIAYALVRPPGHHAERQLFGGFCYFNSAAVAANYLSRFGRVTILDIDYHHGNGQQDIFYERSDVQTISIHGHPRFAYPYFSGFAEETGSGKGAGYNRNYPLPEQLDNSRYHDVLRKALRRLRKFQPQFVVIALGLDTARGDPTGTWGLVAKDFQLNGGLIGALDLPLLVVQEGGYRARSIGINARHFFTGLTQASKHFPTPGALQK